MIFRFDDVYHGSDFRHMSTLVDMLAERFPGSEFMLAVSPMWSDCGDDPRERERIYPRIWNAESDHRKFYNVDGVCGRVTVRCDRHKISVASHGLIHCDHRFLTKETQEMSIVVSCRLLNTDTFVPPFNKYNQDTIDVCKENGIKLVKFHESDGSWRCIEHETYESAEWCTKWYLHSRNVSVEKMKRWLV